MTTVLRTPDLHAAPRRRRRRTPVSALVLAALCVAAYTLAMVVLLANDWLFTDAVSRVGNAYYTLFSRDPHLAAIGFVWNPLPSVLAIPLLLLSPVVREMGSLAIAGTVPTILAVGFTVLLIHATLRRLGVSKRAALILTAVVGLHPYVILATGAGASEMLLMLWLALATWALVAWVSDQDPLFLVIAGLSLGVAYLTRYEAVAAAVAVMIGVAVVSARRHRNQRRAFVLNDVAVVGFPFVTAFAAWAVASKLIMGEWFATFSSDYGNAAQVAFSRESLDEATSWGLGYWGYPLLQATGLMPALMLLIVAALILSFRFRALAAGGVRDGIVVLVPIATFGAAAVFQWVTVATGGSFGWLRFQIAVIPLGVLLAGIIVTSLPARDSALRWVTPLVIALTALALPAGAWTINQPDLAREETVMRAFGEAGQHRMERDIAAELDAAGLPQGSVITDVAYAGPIVLASEHPRQFTITTDRDFADALAAPGDRGVRYALVTRPEVSAADAVEGRYPGMYATGAGVATLVNEWRDGRDYTWRLYEFR